MRSELELRIYRLPKIRKILAENTESKVDGLESLNYSLKIDRSWG